MSSIKRRYIKWIVIFLILLSLISYGSYEYLKPKEPNYMTVSTTMRDIKKQVFATGILAGATEVDIGAQVSGQIKAPRKDWR